ncbi:MAG: 50S ribosomal protein L19 [Candidatus Moranbacteria bacterium RIFCSPLOWO2_02_FULL_48_19]|nr:MAG: 50S ribosomal protein L19 [Candidatus Moranbacteria bacterium RIFCSPLOWO2_02_FULL_48_19]OGI30790.1 MAG: 50S ribosomal protein L19 [Candidatus Moranbacteria bacterium RIFCSPLOWO2_12_FULL_48_12]
MHQKLISFNLKQRKALAIPELRAGDVVNISRKIKEGGKERLQAFQGTIIAINGGQSSSKTITVRKISFGVGVELVLPVSSPQIEKIEFVKRTRARRAKLYYVRDKSVKVLSKKLKEVAVKSGLVPDVSEISSVAEEPVEVGTVEKTEA